MLLYKGEGFAQTTRDRETEERSEGRSKLKKEKKKKGT